nr:adhesive plaque matrix protein-like [Lepeophtheirus salmonis]
MKSFIALSTLMTIAFADHPAPAPYHPAPAPYHPAPSYKPAPYHPAPSYKEEPAIYQYQYAYSVALPDGRIQTVSYNVADAYSGYVADVTYSGEAKYEPYHPAPAPYKAAPVYHDAPSSIQACPVYRPAPVYHAAPAPYKPAPVYKPVPAYEPAPTYKPAPVYHS